MKKIVKSFLVIFTIMIAVTLVFSGMVKKTRSEINFKKFGKYTVVKSEIINGKMKRVDSSTEFKGKGLIGGLTGKLFLKSGEKGEIINLQSMVIYKLDHKKKEYRVVPIEKLFEEREEVEKTGETSYQEEQEKKEESNIKIIRSEFKVNGTGETKEINKFPCKKYTINWFTKWENIRTGEKGTDRLYTEVWTTPITDEIRQAREDEINFSREYMKAIGIDVDNLQQEILGTTWIALFSNMNKENGKPKQQESSQFVKEMKKIEGYPVIIDGKYYITRQKPEGESETTETPNIKKKFGGFLKKAVKKKSKSEKENTPAFSYYTELIEFSTAKIGDEEFQVNPAYKKKE
ncbi:hypothetical protein NLD30_07885 [SCandidatus Aminicenantes bacterium Aminicenantia_JdfR_composite]|nr:hypothetical protein [SCandidatus Aminicenantes bacterium Aminicenantia_JdfR_composite]